MKSISCRRRFAKVRTASRKIKFRCALWHDNCKLFIARTFVRLLAHDVSLSVARRAVFSFFRLSALHIPGVFKRQCRRTVPKTERHKYRCRCRSSVKWIWHKRVQWMHIEAHLRCERSLWSLYANDVARDVPTQQPFADQISLIDEMASNRLAMCAMPWPHFMHTRPAHQYRIETIRVRRVGVRLHLKCHHSFSRFFFFALGKCRHGETTALQSVTRVAYMQISEFDAKQMFGR